MIFIGIDPGIGGGVAVLNKEGDVIFKDSMKELTWLVEILKQHAKQPHMVFCEKGQVMGNKTQGAVGMFNYGHHNGSIEAALIILKMKYELVPPITWCKVIHAGATADRPKEKSRQVIKRLFPDVDLTNPSSPKSIKTHEGIMDAILIAEFGRRKWVYTTGALKGETADR